MSGVTSRVIKQNQQKSILELHNMASSRTLENLNAIVIGAGFGGLASAIELARKGAKVRVFESAPDMKRQGECQVVVREESTDLC